MTSAVSKPAPILAGLMGFALFSSLGLPGLNGFVGEFLIFRGVFRWRGFRPLFRAGAAGYCGRDSHRDSESLSGPVPSAAPSFPDLHPSERLAMAPVIALMILIGLVPQLITDSVNPTVVYLLAHWRF